MSDRPFYDWTDHWYRSAVHWAIINRHTSALRALIENGCSMTPPLPNLNKKNRRTSALIESPIMLATRLYDLESDSDSKEILSYCKEHA